VSEPSDLWAGIVKILNRIAGRVEDAERDRDRHLPERLREAHQAARPENGHDTSKLEDILNE
jgi:hypothetical protein